MKNSRNILVVILLCSLTMLTARSVFMESLATTAIIKMDQKDFTVNKMYEEGLLGEGESVYRTFNFYKGVVYSLSIGSGEKIEKLSACLYDANYNLVQKAIVDSQNNEFPTLLIEPKYSGSYFLKITVEKGAKNDNEWMFIYGYKTKVK